MADDKKITITLVKSPIGYSHRQKAIVKALGLGKMNSSVERVDVPTIRGMITKVSHLVKVEG
jgi:large subunit ribosomal protein L30